MAKKKPDTHNGRALSLVELLGIFIFAPQQLKLSARFTRFRRPGIDTQTATAAVFPLSGAIQKPSTIVKTPARGSGFYYGGAAGYRTQVRMVTYHSSTSIVNYKIDGDISIINKNNIVRSVN